MIKQMVCVIAALLFADASVAATLYPGKQLANKWTTGMVIIQGPGATIYIVSTEHNKKNKIVNGWLKSGEHVYRRPSQWRTITVHPVWNKKPLISMEMRDDTIIHDAIFAEDGSCYVVGSSGGRWMVVRMAKDSSLAWKAPTRCADSLQVSGTAWAIGCGTNGQVYVAGSRINSFGKLGLVVESYSAEGKSLWCDTSGGGKESPAEARDICVSPGGGLVVAGNILNSSGAFVVEYSPAGDIRWRTQINGVTGWNIVAHAVAIDHLGRICVAGYIERGKEKRGLLSLLDSSGKRVWSVTSEGFNGDSAEYNAVAFDGNGRILAGGSDLPEDVLDGPRIIGRLYSIDGILLQDTYTKNDSGGNINAANMYQRSYVYGAYFMNGEAVLVYEYGKLGSDNASHEAKYYLAESVVAGYAPGGLLKRVPRKTTLRNIAMFVLDNREVPSGDAVIVTDAVRERLASLPDIHLVERIQLNEIVAEQMFQQGSCTELDCRVRVGRLLNATEIIVGSYGKVGNAYVLVMHLIEVERGSIIQSQTATYASSKDALHGAGELGVSLIDESK